VAGTANTNAIWAAVFSSNPGDTASVTYTGPTTPGTIAINAIGGPNSTVIQACANDGCGFGNLVDGNAIINATGNLKGVFGTQGFGLDAVAAGNGNATVNYNGGTIDLHGNFPAGIFASSVFGSAKINTLPGTNITVGQQSSTDIALVGIDAFSTAGAATDNVASTIQVSAVTDANADYRLNPTGIRASTGGGDDRPNQCDLGFGGPVSVTYTGPGITVHGGGGLGIAAVSTSGSVMVDAATGSINADGSSAVGILADSGRIRNGSQQGCSLYPTTVPVSVNAGNVSTPGHFGTAISATGGTGLVTVNIPHGISVTGGWQADAAHVGAYGLPSAGVILGTAGGR
jgi:hypothetical protein